jgi:hypothetical protein
MKNPPRFRTHLEGWRPTVALAGHIVVATFAGLRLVGGTVRSSQDASEQLTRQIVVSTYLLLGGYTFRRLWRATSQARQPFAFFFSQASVRGRRQQQARNNKYPKERIFQYGDPFSGQCQGSFCLFVSIDLIALRQ